MNAAVQSSLEALRAELASIDAVRAQLQQAVEALERVAAPQPAPPTASPKPAPKKASKTASKTVRVPPPAKAPASPPTVPPAPPGLGPTAARREQGKTMLRDGATPKQVAELLACDISTVYLWKSSL